MFVLKTENVRKLFTKEDPQFVHKCLGIFCLANFTYRYIQLLTHGSMDITISYDVFTVLIHALLSWSSLIFHISAVRHKTLPTIYPEFRMHSIIFACRSVLCTLCHYYRIRPIFLVLICLGTNVSADTITWYYAQTLKHSEDSSTTMRNMPFDKKIADDERKTITRMHSCAQVTATLFMLGTRDSAFSPLFAIQLAAFLMTLVRKNIITTNTWHLVYTFSLWINIFVVYGMTLSQIVAFSMCYDIFCHFRFRLGVNKYLAWIYTFNAYYLIIYFGQKFVIATEYECFLLPAARYGIILYTTYTTYQNVRPLLIDKESQASVNEVTI